MVMCLHQNAGRNKYLKRDDSPFEMLDAFWYVGTTQTNKYF
jgi:hypothetical protein